MADITTATKITSSRFKKVEKQDISKLKLSEIFVKIGNDYVKISDLCVKSKDGKFEEIKSLADFNWLLEVKGQQKQFKSNIQVYLKGELTQISGGITYPIIEDKSIPKIETFETTSINPQKGEIQYGTKRTLNVVETTEANLPVRADGSHKDVYVKVKQNGKWTFVSKDEIVWFDGAERKTCDDLTKLPQNVQLRTAKDNQPISEIYTEYVYQFDKWLKKEEYDFEKGTVVTKERVEKDGKEVENTSAPVKFSNAISVQDFVKVEEPVENSTETRMVSKRKVVNYKYNKNGNFISVIVDKQIKLVDVNNLRDLDGNKIAREKLNDYVGQPIQVQDGEKTFKTDLLTYQQANMFYAVEKHHELVKEMSETSELRLDDGNYVKEKDCVQPLAYAVVDDGDYDNFLVKKTENGSERWVIVDKEYFTKNGADKTLNSKTAIKLKRCNFHSPDCAVVQTTRKRVNAKDKAKVIEECSIVNNKKIETENFLTDEQVKAKKEDAFNGFMFKYKNGEYPIEDVYASKTATEPSKIQTPGVRYEYTDVTYLGDPADKYYDSIKTSNIKINEKGELEGGAKYDVGKANASAFKVLGKIFVTGLGFGVVSALIPVIGPFVSAGFAVGCAAAVPLIPIVNGIIGGIKNASISRMKKQANKKNPKNIFKDKIVEDKKEDVSTIEHDLKDLLEKSTRKKNPYNQTQFDDYYSKITNMISSLAPTISNGTLKIENGSAVVNSDNANLAIQYAVKMKNNISELERVQRELKTAKTDYETYKTQLDQKRENGKNVSEKEEKNLKAKKDKYDSLVKQLSQLESEQTALNNGTFSQDYPNAHKDYDKLQKLAMDMKTYVYMKKFSDKFPELSEVKKEDGTTLQVELDMEKGVAKIDGKDYKITFNTSKGLMIGGKTIDKCAPEIKQVITNIQDEFRKAEVAKNEATTPTNNEPVDKQNVVDEDKETKLETVDKKAEAVANANANANNAPNGNAEEDAKTKKKKTSVNDALLVGEKAIMEALNDLSECIQSGKGESAWSSNCSELYAKLKGITNKSGNTLTKKQLLDHINKLTQTLKSNIESNPPINTKITKRSPVQLEIFQTTAKYLNLSKNLEDGSQISIFDN